MHTCDELSSARSATTDRFESSDRYVALRPDFPVSIVQLRNVRYRGMACSVIPIWRSPTLLPVLDDLRGPGDAWNDKHTFTHAIDEETRGTMQSTHTCRDNNYNFEYGIVPRKGT